MPQHGPPGDIHGAQQAVGGAPFSGDTTAPGLFPPTITVGGGQPAADGADAGNSFARIIQAAEAAAAEDGISEHERLFLEQIRTLAQRILADREKDEQKLLGSGQALGRVAHRG